MSICNQTKVNMESLQQLFNNLQQELYKAMDKGVNDVDVIPEGRNFQYYEKLIKIFNNKRYKD